MKKLSVAICNRSNYSKLKPILLELKNNTDIDIRIIASSDMALQHTPTAVPDIKNDGFNIDKQINCLLMDDTLACMGKTIGVSMIEHSSYFENHQPNALLIVGDRFDIMPAVLSAKIQNIPILHLQGGERSGSIDDTIRDLISVCATRHYVATEQSYKNVERIAKIKNIFNFGCPSIEAIMKVNVGEYLDTRTFKKQYHHGFGIAPHEKYMLVIVHPDTENEKEVDMDILLEAVLSFNMKCVVIHPNIDAFNSRIMTGLKDHSNRIIHVRHMPLEDFVQLMAHASCMVGNSSAGIRETGSFGTPTVNVGDRQVYRERNKNTIDCDNSYNGIVDAIQKSLSVGRYEKSNVYYQKDSTKNICADISAYLNQI